MLLWQESLQERKKYHEPNTHGQRVYAHLESNIVIGNGKTRFKRKLLVRALLLLLTAHQ